MQAQELFDTITHQLIADIEAGAGDWTMPWHQLATITPAQSIDGRSYRGLNSLILGLTASGNGWTNIWGTYRSLQRAGHQVTKGERGTKVALWKETKPAANTDEVERPRLFARTFTVFALEQTNAPQPEPAAAICRPDADAHPGAAAALDALGAKMIQTAHPHYRPASDTIGMPPPDAFDSEADRLSTLAHEHVHRTGHPTRLDRDLSGRFGDRAYGFEELVAEIGSAFWCAQHGVTTLAKRLDHADYVADWLTILREDSRAIVTAASKAQQAVDLMNQPANTKPVDLASV